MSVNRFNGTPRVRTDILDNITPNNVVQPNVSVPAGEWKPAEWLPVAWQGESSKDNFVIASGKVVAFDGEGRICPAGLALITGGDTLVTYTQADVDAKVIDIRTGAELLQGAIGAVTADDAVDALFLRGLLPSDHDGPANDGVGASTMADFISEPVGVAAYDVYCWGGEEDAQKFNNYRKQHLIQFLTDVQMQLPQAADTAAKSSAPGGRLIDRAALVAGPYANASLGADVVGFALDGIVAHTSRTPVASSDASELTRHVSSPARIKKAGDFYVDPALGFLLAYELGGNSDLAGTFSYFATGTAIAGEDRHVCFAGAAKPGQRVGFDKYSNLTADAAGKLGRVLALVRQPRGLLERVRTGFSGQGFGKDAQMPGSATAGYTDLITLNDEKCADTVVIVNIKA